MILWVFYGLPVVLDIRLEVFAAAMLAIAICDSAFEAEIFRAGIQSSRARPARGGAWRSGCRPGSACAS